MRKAKIICTIGPASSDESTIESLIKNGMDVARLNFSHGDYKTHERYIKLIRKISNRYKKPVAILQDLKGIKIRIDRIKGKEIKLKKGTIVKLVSGTGISNEELIYIPYPALPKDIKKGNKILLNDGLIQLNVIKVQENTIVTKVIEAGLLEEKKGVNFVGMPLHIKTFTEKDKKDLSFGIRMNVDYIALSFVRNANDVRIVKKWLKRKGITLPIIAKIERPEAVENIEDILCEVDGIMVARGDLGVEMSSERIPIIQKELINKANKKGKIVITATQMLESMTEHMRPTRAETTDVANAVLDGTDALMLSSETATGKYPVNAVKMMDRIIRYTESIKHGESSYIRGNTIADAVADAACRAAEDMSSKVLVAFTRSGFTARLVSKLRPMVSIIAYTSSEKVMKRMCLYWGITPKIMKPLTTTDEMVKEVEKSLIREKIVEKGDRVIITSSSPLSTMKKTNFMKIHMIGE